MRAAQENGSLEVPMYIRNAPTALMKYLGAGDGCRYAREKEDGFGADENYFPESLSNPVSHRPVEQGFDILVAEKLRSLREHNRKACEK